MTADMMARTIYLPADTTIDLTAAKTLASQLCQQASVDDLRTLFEHGWIDDTTLPDPDSCGDDELAAAAAPLGGEAWPGRRSRARGGRSPPGTRQMPVLSCTGTWVSLMARGWRVAAANACATTMGVRVVMSTNSSPPRRASRSPSTAIWASRVRDAGEVVVAELVAVAIVDLVHVVDVGDGHGQLDADRVGEVPLGEAAHRQPGDRVGVGLGQLGLQVAGACAGGVAFGTGLVDPVVGDGEQDSHPGDAATGNDGRGDGVVDEQQEDHPALGDERADEPAASGDRVTQRCQEHGRTP
jgi:hypothetical protein